MSAHAYSPPTEEMRAARSRKTIVVVDDLKDLLDVTAMLLQGEGYSVRVAGDGETGLRLAQECEADLVLLDHLIPGMSGADVGRALRAGRGKRTKIVMSSATPLSEIESDFDDYDEFLKKPVPPADLLEIVAHLLEV